MSAAFDYHHRLTHFSGLGNYPVTVDGVADFMALQGITSIRLSVFRSSMILHTSSRSRLTSEA
ncbi:MAG: hypothetical protein LUQ59_05470 [Methanothrix sp.]|nr:hypothetical protein [Methanothrix sp.]